MDITLSPSTVTWRTIGGILDFFLFLGPEPEMVTKQYTSVIGRSAMVPYWSLGFQLGRLGHENLADMEKSIARIRNYKIPYDVQYGDIDYMIRNLDFTIDPENFANLPQFVEKLQNNWNMKFVTVLDPAISLEGIRV